MEATGASIELDEISKRNQQTENSATPANQKDSFSSSTARLAERRKALYIQGAKIASSGEKNHKSSDCTKVVVVAEKLLHAKHLAI